MLTLGIAAATRIAAALRWDGLWMDSRKAPVSEYLPLWDRVAEEDLPSLRFLPALSARV